MAEKILAHFDHYNLINEEALTVQNCYLHNILSKFQNLMVGFTKTLRFIKLEVEKKSVLLVLINLTQETLGLTVDPQSMYC